MTSASPVITASGGSRPSSAKKPGPALECARVGLGVLARVQLDVRDPAVVVDHAVEVVVADPAAEVFDGAVACHAMVGDADAGKLLDVDMQQRTRARPFVRR